MATVAAGCSAENVVVDTAASAGQWALTMLPAVSAAELLRHSVRVGISNVADATQILRSYTDGSGLTAGPDPATGSSGPTANVTEWLLVPQRGEPASFERGDPPSRPAGAHGRPSGLFSLKISSAHGQQQGDSARRHLGPAGVQPDNDMIFY